MRVKIPSRIIKKLEAFPALNFIVNMRLERQQIGTNVVNLVMVISFFRLNFKKTYYSITLSTS